MCSTRAQLQKAHGQVGYDSVDDFAFQLDGSRLLRRMIPVSHVAYAAPLSSGMPMVAVERSRDTCFNGKRHFDFRTNSLPLYMSIGVCKPSKPADQPSSEAAPAFCRRRRIKNLPEG